MARKPSQSGPLRSNPLFKSLGEMAGIALCLREKNGTLSWPSGARSLETQLGGLDRGQLDWWRNRPEHAKALATLLEIDVVDLGLDGSKPGPHVFSFPHLPRMPSLDLLRRKPWVLGREVSVDKPVSMSQPLPLPTLEEWFSPPAGWHRPPYHLNWLCIDDDLERRVVGATLAAAGRFEVIHAGSLPEVEARLRSSRPLIVVLQGSAASINDTRNALALRPEGVGVLVIAPHPLEESDTEHLGLLGVLDWEYQSGDATVRRDADLRVQRFKWERIPDWRERLLKWLEDHLNAEGVDSLYSEVGTGRWLKDFDPDEAWFDSVSSVLALCLCYDGEKKLPKKNDRDAGQRLLEALQLTQPDLDVGLLKALALERWHQREAPWEGALSGDDWAAMARNSALSPDAETLSKIVELENLEERAQAAERWRVASIMRNVSGLRSSGLLVPRFEGYELGHRSLAHLLIRDHLMEVMEAAGAANVADWAWMSFDAQRVCLIDAALDALPEKKLYELARSGLQQVQFRQEWIGLLEAIFCSVGRRLEAGVLQAKDARKFTPLAQDVVLRILANASEYELPLPLSRLLKSEQQRVEWIAVCWAWSMTQRPEWAPANSWLFPGWCPHPSTYLYYSPWLWLLWPEQGLEHLPRYWQPLLRQANHWVKKLDEPLPQVPRILAIAHLLRASQGGWDAQAEWWDHLYSGERFGLADPLIEYLPKDRFAVDAAFKLWPSYVAWEHADRLKEPKYWIPRAIRLRRWMLDSLSTRVDEALERVGQEGCEHLAYWASSLPPSWRGKLLVFLKPRFIGAPMDQFVRTLRRFGPSTFAVLADMLSGNELEILAGKEVARLLWEWDESKACVLLKDAALSTAACKALLAVCPAKFMKEAVSLLHERPGVLGDGLHAWVKSKLPGSGAYANALLEFLA